jgi:hypothetical protein
MTPCAEITGLSKDEVCHLIATRLCQASGERSLCSAGFSDLFCCFGYLFLPTARNPLDAGTNNAAPTSTLSIICRASAVHTTTDIPLSAFGPNAWAFIGLMNNRDVFFKLAQGVTNGSVIPPDLITSGARSKLRIRGALLKN